MRNYFFSLQWFSMKYNKLLDAHELDIILISFFICSQHTRRAKYFLKSFLLTVKTLSACSMAVSSSTWGSVYLPNIRYMDFIISRISSLVIRPSLSMSYKLKVHFNLSTVVPRVIIDSPVRNSYDKTEKFATILTRHLTNLKKMLKIMSFDSLSNIIKWFYVNSQWNILRLA